MAEDTSAAERSACLIALLALGERALPALPELERGRDVTESSHASSVDRLIARLRAVR